MAPKKSPKTIRVFLRIRPPMGREIEEKHTYKNIVVENETTVAIRKGDTTKRFNFHGIFDQNSTQDQVYKAYAHQAVDAAFDGQHGVLFVYGQTGSGKTFTMSNDTPGKLGVLQQSMTEVWQRIAADTAHEYSCTVSYTQLYNEILSDLIGDPANNRVRLQLGPEGLGDVVLVRDSDGMSIEKDVRNFAETMEYFNLGASRKAMAETGMNKVSSRSHTIFTFHVRKARKIGAIVVDNSADAAAAIASPSTMALEGRLVICDLAGSERASKTHAEGKRLEEAASINLALLTLGNVVSALTDKHSQHVPFRESKLTRLLQYSLSGNGNTSIIVNVSPSDDNTEETLGSIAFGQRAIQIKQDSKRHEVIDYKALYLQLQAQLDSQMDTALQEALREERVAYEEQIAQLKDKVRILEEENALLRAEGGGGGVGAASSPAASGKQHIDPAAMAAAAAIVKEGVVGGSGSAASGSGKDFTPEGWRNIVAAMRATVEDREKRLREKEDERQKLGRLLMDEKQKSFALGKKLYALAVRLREDRSHYSVMIDDLNAQLAGARGTDYISAGGLSTPRDEDDGALVRTPLGPQMSPAASDAGGSESGLSSASGSSGISATVQAELDRAYEAIQRLKHERVELIVYQVSAQKAIHYLAHQLRQAGVKVAGVK